MTILFKRNLVWENAALHCYKENETLARLVSLPRLRSHVLKTRVDMADRARDNRQDIDSARRRRGVIDELSS
jgi:hypothetical protein